MCVSNDNKQLANPVRTLRPKLTEVIRKHNIFPKKFLGQHFLLNTSICERIVQSSGNLTRTNVIEVGPGPGGLTRALLDNGAQHVIVIEKDNRCINAMNELALSTNGRLEIKHGDALSFDFIQKISDPKCIISNLPYNIATKLLFKWLKYPNEFSQMVLMFQKEVGRRIIAKPGTSEYGRLSIYAQWLCKCELVFDLKPGAFSPPPKVSSSVIRLTPYPKPLYDAPEEELLKIVSAGFGQRRKKLKTSLKTAISNPEIVLSNADISPDLRAETLTLKEWCTLAKAFAYLLKINQIQI